MTTIGKRIFTIRKARRLSRPQLAQLSRISREHLWAVETDQYAPSLLTIEKVATGLGVGVGQFFNEPAILFEDPLVRALVPLVRKLSLYQRGRVLDTLRQIAGPSWAKQRNAEKTLGNLNTESVLQL